MELLLSHPGGEQKGNRSIVPFVTSNVPPRFVGGKGRKQEGEM